MTYCTYEQATGLFTIHTPLPFRCVGYAGRREGRNNPALERVISVGPIPRGKYHVGLAHRSSGKGPYTMRLTPFGSNTMHGRSGFLIHGDNAASDASHGCIILPRHAREVLARHRTKNSVILEVFALLPSSKEKRPQGVDLISLEQVTPAGAR